MFEKVMATTLTEEDHPTARTFGAYVNSGDCLILSDRHKGEHISPPPVLVTTTIRALVLDDASPVLLQ